MEIESAEGFDRQNQSMIKIGGKTNNNFLASGRNLDTKISKPRILPNKPSYSDFFNIEDSPKGDQDD